MDDHKEFTNSTSKTRTKPAKESSKTKVDGDCCKGMPTSTTKTGTNHQNQTVWLESRNQEKVQGGEMSMSARRCQVISRRS